MTDINNIRGVEVINDQDMLIVAKEEAFLSIDACTRVELVAAGKHTHTYFFPLGFWGRVRAAWQLFKWLKP